VITSCCTDMKYALSEDCDFQFIKTPGTTKSLPQLFISDDTARVNFCPWCGSEVVEWLDYRPDEEKA
jgi:hypothetical protein